MLPALAAFLGAWFAAQFALRRFTKEKVWEKKAEAYTAIFGALHHIGNWYSENFDALVASREVPSEREEELSKEYDKARAQLQLVIDSNIWVLPWECRVIVQAMFTKMEMKKDDWLSHLDENQSSILEARNKLRSLARADQGVAPQKWRSMRAWVVARTHWLQRSRDPKESDDIPF